MNKKSYIVQKIAILIVNTLLLSSCLKEDMSNCPEQIRVYFDINTLDGADEINPNDVDRMNLYVFCNKGYYLGEYRDDHITDFDPDNYYIDCSDLLPGKYRFIAWAGKDENFFNTTPEPFVKGKTKFEKALLALKHSNGMVTDKVHHLFHSELPATVTNEKVQRFDMPLIQQTNTINIRTVGLLTDDCTYSFNITDNNNIYNFDSSFATDITDATFTYTAPFTKDGMHQLHSTLNVMRLAANRQTPQLQIYNETTGTTLYPFGNYSGDLIGLIKSAYPKNDFEKTHTYDIVLVFGNGNGDGDTNFTMTILINGWQVREQNNDLVE